MEARALMATAMERLFDPESKTFWNNAVKAPTLPLFEAAAWTTGSFPRPTLRSPRICGNWGGPWTFEAWRALSRHMVQARFAKGPARIGRVGKMGVTCTWTKPKASPLSWSPWPPTDQRHAVTKAWWTDASGLAPGWTLSVREMPTSRAWMEGKRPGAEGQPRWYVCQEGACQLACQHRLSKLGTFARCHDTKPTTNPHPLHGPLRCARLCCWWASCFASVLWQPRRLGPRGQHEPERTEGREAPREGG